MGPAVVPWRARLARLMYVMQDGTADDEFLCARLLFLCAYGADPGYEKLVEKHALATSITTVWTLRRLSSPRTALHSTSPLTTAVPQKLTAHAASPSPSQSPADPTTTATQTAPPALTETLKLLFTLLHHAPTLTPLFSGATTAAVLRLLLAAPHTHGAVTRATHDPSAPLPHLVSALLSLPLDAATAFDEPPPPPPPLLHEGSGAEESREAQDAMGETHLVACLVSLLDASLAPATPANTPMPMSAPGPTTSLTAPLLALLRRVHALTAPIPPAATLTVAQQTARTYLSASLLPRPVDRLLPLGTGPSLPHRLLRLLSPASLVPPASSPAAATANSSISRSSADAPAAASLLLELSGHNADALVRHIGFGLASGALADAGLSATAPSPSSSSSSTTIEGQPIDFVTGQFIEARDAAAAGTRRPDGDGAGTREMSDAEKLREAERLYVLFERLRATGVVCAENPVHAAARAGGLVTELAEGDEDEDDD